MKLTLEEVLDNYVVLLEDECETVGYEFQQDGSVQFFWDHETHSFFADLNQQVEADGDIFTVTDEDGKKYNFRAAKIVKLDEIPEIR